MPLVGAATWRDTTPAAPAPAGRAKHSRCAEEAEDNVVERSSAAGAGGATTQRAATAVASANERKPGIGYSSRVAWEAAGPCDPGPYVGATASPAATLPYYARKVTRRSA